MSKYDTIYFVIYQRYDFEHQRVKGLNTLLSIPKAH